jgi:hypothetical protein
MTEESLSSELMMLWKSTQPLSTLMQSSTEKNEKLSVKISSSLDTDFIAFEGCFPSEKFL